MNMPDMKDDEKLGRRLSDRSVRSVGCAFVCGSCDVEYWGSIRRFTQISADFAL